MKNHSTTPQSETRAKQSTRAASAQPQAPNLERKEDALDEALQETFPASDPIAVQKSPPARPPNRLGS